MDTDAFQCEAGVLLPSRLWLYTNYDCNLSCTYCVAESHPRAERRAIPLATFQQLIAEADEAGFTKFFLTGGEPFILPDIHERIASAIERRPTTVLTNAIVISGQRLERLLPLRDSALTLQVSLDGARPELHDAYRGPGVWAKTVDRIRELVSLGFHVAIGATETPANTGHIDELRIFVAALGVAEEDFFVRPLAKRGFSSEGIELGAADIVPELTVSNEGFYWHPLTTGPDLLLTKRLFPLRDALSLLHTQYHAVLRSGGRPRPFK